MDNEIAEEVAETSTTPEDAESSSVESEVSDANEPDASSESDAEPEGDRPNKHRARERIEQLNAEKKAALEAAEYWRSLATKQPEKQESVAEDPRPSLEQFDYDQDKWAAALTDWADRQIDRRAEEAVSKTVAKQRTQAEQDAQRDKWIETAAKFAEQHPDFEAVAYNPSVPISTDMFSVMQASERGPDIAYHLGKNPDKAARIARMSPQAQAMAIGRLEAELSRPAPKPKPSNAPEPPNPVGGAATPSVNPKDMSIDDWMKWRAKELRSKRS